MYCKRGFFLLEKNFMKLLTRPFPWGRFSQQLFSLYNFILVLWQILMKKAISPILLKLPPFENFSCLQYHDTHHKPSESLKVNLLFLTLSLQMKILKFRISPTTNHMTSSRVSVWSPTQGGRWSSVTSARHGSTSRVPRSVKTIFRTLTHANCVKTPNSPRGNQIEFGLRTTNCRYSLISAN